MIPKIDCARREKLITLGYWVFRDHGKWGVGYHRNVIIQAREATKNDAWLRADSDAVNSELIGRE